MPKQIVSEDKTAAVVLRPLGVRRLSKMNSNDDVLVEAQKSEEIAPRLCGMVVPGYLDKQWFVASLVLLSVLAVMLFYLPLHVFLGIA